MSELVLGLLLPVIGTTVGAGFVFFIKDRIPVYVEKALLGFASGVMIAASVWSLLIPSMNMVGDEGVMTVVPAAVGFLLGHGLGIAHVIGATAGQGELGQAQGIGAVGGGLARGDQLVGGGDGIVDDGGQLQKDVLGEGVLLGPVGDVGAHDEIHGRIGLAEAVVEPLFVDLLVEVVLVGHIVVVDIRSRSDDTAVAGSSGDGAGVHERHARKLTLAGLGTLAVGEVAGGVSER